MKRIYLDNNATTKPDPEVVEAMRNCLEHAWGNPSSLHSFGQEARRVVDLARARAARLIGAATESIIFTSGGTEANNLAIEGVVRSNGKRHVITSSIEHPSVLSPCRRLSEQGFEVTFVPVDSFGVVDADQAIAAMKDRTALVSIMLANNETGVIQPVAEIARAARERGIIVHTDAVQAAGKIPLDMEQLRVDLLSFSGHKISGPKGTGALYVSKATHISPILIGGHQERMIRAGTENAPSIAGFGAACELSAERLQTFISHTISLRERFERGVLGGIEGTRVNGHPALRLSNTSNISFKGMTARLLAMSLDIKGLAVSTGASCAAGRDDPSHVLTAMGLTREQAQSSLRFSFGPENTVEDIDRAIYILHDTVRKMSR